MKVKKLSVLRPTRHKSLNPRLQVRGSGLRNVITTTNRSLPHLIAIGL